jgi:hypothetical protein
MDQRTRRHDTPAIPGASSGATTSGTPAAFNRAQTLKTRIGDVLDGRIGNDSEKFIQQNRQHGGQ